ncbi:MAG: hypothetical protein OHK0053_04650 [Microscillaceae bacterium]
MTLLWGLSACQDEAADAGRAADNSTNGQGGSLARFAITGDYLYAVGFNDLKVYDIRQPEHPVATTTIPVGINIETIFPYQNLLFIGSQTGMYIYQNNNPEQPQFLSRYDHIQSCDPVVAQGNYAYVTLRDGTNCRFGSNLLDVIDISNPSQPQVVNSLLMFNPHGLGIDGSTLFVCEGTQGLKVFDVNEPRYPQLIQHLQGFDAYDVIPNNGVLILTGANGIFQYQYVPGQPLVFLSQLL